MSYIDAGYAIGLGVLGLYGALLVVRRRRLAAPAPPEPDRAAP
ncbi:MAG: hypothetical protein ACYDA2_04085 [Acidimicrobiales bacterium]